MLKNECKHSIYYINTLKLVIQNASGSLSIKKHTKVLKATKIIMVTSYNIAKTGQYVELVLLGSIWSPESFEPHSNDCFRPCIEAACTSSTVSRRLAGFLPQQFQICWLLWQLAELINSVTNVVHIRARYRDLMSTLDDQFPLR